jgi:hypothetical protein
MSYPSAARTNLTSHDVAIHSNKIGEGAFRVCLEGTFVGGNRNGQAAVCKRFKPHLRHLEDEYFMNDFSTIDLVVKVADKWNSWCQRGWEIVVNRGSIHHSRSGIPYLVEPYIRDYDKFLGNNGWIGCNSCWKVRIMEAFVHYSYHVSGSSNFIVCDLQGQYKHNRRNFSKSRFELTDPAICSRHRGYGMTDLGEKGIDSFFANHQCNEFCQGDWARPTNPYQWFPRSQGTSMMASTFSDKLRLTSTATFRIGTNNMIEEEGSLSDYSDAY